MTDPNFVLLYVASPEASAAFYTDLLGKAPVEASPGFAMFALSSGVMLGLWARDTVKPAAGGTPGAGELAFCLDSDAQVDERHAAWRARGLEMIQAPCKLDFGYTFVAIDPDGHRLRVFSPSQP